MGLMDKATDKIASAVSGTKIETIKVSYDEIISLTKRVIIEAGSQEELKKIGKVVKGRISPTFKSYTLENQKYCISTHYTATLASKGIFNNVEVLDKESGKNYKYSVFLAGKYKKAATKLVKMAENANKDEIK